MGKFRAVSCGRGCEWIFENLQNTGLDPSNPNGFLLRAERMSPLSVCNTPKIASNCDEQKKTTGKFEGKTGVRVS